MWKQLKEMSKISKDNKLEKIYKTWANSSYKLSETFEAQNLIYNNEIKKFFIHYKNELKWLIDLTYKCNDFQNRYDKEYNQLLDKKESTFNKLLKLGINHET